MTNAFMILNPKAGQSGSRGLKLPDIDRELHELGVSCELAFTKQHGDGAKLAAKAVSRGYDMVIAAGGDGTVNDVVNGLVGTKVPLAILPVGTVNVLARDLGISLDMEKALQTVAGRSVKNIDVGRVGDKYFTLMAGLGFDAEVVSGVTQPVKDVIGAGAYFFKSLETLTWYKASDVTLTMPEQTYSSKAFLIIVANVSRYSLFLEATPDASPEDGMLDIVIFEKAFADRLGFLRQVTDMFASRHLEHDQVKLFRASRVHIESDPQISVQIDGDPFGKTPVDIEVEPAALSVIVPGEAEGG